MAERSVFLDTSGIFAWINAKDPFHGLMCELPRTQGVKLVVTDYVIDEASALFLARGIGHRRSDLLGLVKTSHIVRLEWIGPDRFWHAWDWLNRFNDQPFSLTDCTSFVVMKSLRIREAASSDAHFKTAGFVPLLSV